MKKENELVIWGVNVGVRKVSKEGNWYVHLLNGFEMSDYNQFEKYD